MNIAVCVKQVPDTADIKLTENNTIQREGLESVINPFDLYALETALKLKDKDFSIKICCTTYFYNTFSILYSSILLLQSEVFP